METFINILNSNALQTLVALAVGTFIFIQYKLRKRDEVKRAASLIVTEIQTAERKIKNVKRRLADGVLDADVSIIPTNSWERYRYMLAPFLDRDEWDAVEDFYDRAQMLDETIKYNDQMFRNDVEQIRINKQRAVADFAIETVNNISSTDNREDVAAHFSNKVQVYDTLYMSKQGEMSYTPNRIIEDAKKYLENLPSLLSSPSIIKLKQVADKGRA